MMTHLYRLYTERQPDTVLIPLVARYVSGATLIPARGLWHGGMEDSVIIEILGMEADLGAVQALREDIKATSAQESVLLTIQRVEGYL